MKIYTKTGDAGETALFDGTRVPKADPRVDAYGDVDELNAWLGLARAARSRTPSSSAMLERIQRDLFAIGARLADPAHRIAARVTKAAVADADVDAARAVDRRARSRAAAAAPLHPRRRLAGRRRAARGAHRLPPRRARMVACCGDRRRSSRICSIYVNRLSDLLFVHGAARPTIAPGCRKLEW